MSSAVVSTSAALGRPFVFDDDVDPVVLPDSGGDSRPRLSGRAKLDGNDRSAARILPVGVTSASRLEIRPTPQMVSSGIPAIDAITGGLPRGCLTEVCGPASSGRTTVLLAALAAATRRGEFCVVVDASDALDPHSVAAAGVELDHLLWVRCGEASPLKNSSPQRRRGTEKNFPENSEYRIRARSTNQSDHRLEQVLRATDLLLESGGFALIVLDLGDMPTQAARRIPLTTWFRFRRAIEHTPTIFLAIEQHPIAGSCSSLLLQLGSTDEIAAERLAAERRKNAAHGASGGFVAGNEQAPKGRKKITLIEHPTLEFQIAAPPQLLTGLDITLELIRSRLERKPTCSTAVFSSKTAWAG